MERAEKEIGVKPVVTEGKLPLDLNAELARSDRWHRVKQGVIIAGGTLALLLATSLGNGEVPKFVYAGGASPAFTNTATATNTPRPEQAATNVAALQTQQAKNEKEISELKTQVTAASATPIPTSTPVPPPKIEVTVIVPTQPASGPEVVTVSLIIVKPDVVVVPPVVVQPSAVSPPPAPTAQPSFPPPTSTFSPPELTATVVTHDTALAKSVADELADRAKKRAAEATPTLTSTPTATSTVTPKPGNEGYPVGTLIAGVVIGATIATLLTFGYRRRVVIMDRIEPVIQRIHPHHHIDTL